MINYKKNICWFFKNVYSSDEINNINKLVDKNYFIGPNTAAKGVTKTSVVKTFELGKISILDRFLLCCLDANKFNFGYNLYIPQSNLNAHHLTYDEKFKSEYDWHLDLMFDHPATDLKLTCILNVSDEPFEGGSLWLASGEPIEVKEIIEPGSAIIFPSFIMHKVDPVIKGKRKVIALWLTGPKFQ